MQRMPEVRFDDIPGLEKLISDQHGPFGEPITITQKMIDDFADITQDHQWIHVDPERATKEGPFDGTVAHGFLVLSMVTALGGGGDNEITGFGSAINYGADKLRFVSPVPADSAIHARRRIDAVRRKGPATQVTFETEVWVVGGKRPAMTYRSLALFMR